MTTDRPQSDTLAAALPREMVRVTKIAGQYRQVEMGFIAADLMEAAVERGQQAIESGDLTRMIRAYHDLKGYEL
ncbi:hypothetical protein ABID82_005006 [Methylobacterium sp. PvP062]|uniref:Uncharacterized protein n=1 Tax=Methylobacterium radiotolerans TaxID=31998 RepID=A0ABV2NP09_9HYPH|nr:MULTISPECIES: hypothetical protein [unclassified Methylobacterium]MBP2495009.1 hypothetical protein [Methylobacterium sp. PvP105]MBP2505120.1 hypothetical protein [Methylobacterium sp. PvP109]MCX7331356.1 hypothetical protein [Hyphomicrobiales bacterium]